MSFIATRGLLSSSGMRVPEHMGLVVVMHGLICPTAGGILVPQSGIQPESPALEGGLLTTGPSGKTRYCLKIFYEHSKTYLVLPDTRVTLATSLNCLWSWFSVCKMGILFPALPSHLREVFGA